MAELHDRTIALLEARRATELASLVERHGGKPISAPTLREVHRPEAPELAEAIDALIAGKFTAVVFLTGVGATTLLAAAELRGQRAQLVDALRLVQIAARGPKPAAVLRREGVAFEQAPEPNTTRELIALLATWQLADRDVLVQLYGEPNEPLHSALEAQGARITEVSPYTWDLAEDHQPVLKLIDELNAERIDVIAATSASQIANLFAMARLHQQEPRLRTGLALTFVAAQGPVCAAAWQRERIEVDLTAPRGHMGALVLAIADVFDKQPVAAVPTGRN